MVMSQVEGETWIRAGALVALGLVLSLASGVLPSSREG
jgi:hypothetical protein